MKKSLTWQRRIRLSAWERRRPLILVLFFAAAAILCSVILGLPLSQLILGFPVWGWITASGVFLLLVVALLLD